MVYGRYLYLDKFSNQLTISEVLLSRGEERVDLASTYMGDALGIPIGRWL